METKTIVRVNNVDIIATSDEQLVAIRPICEALGIDRKRQQDKIKEHPILSAVGGLKPLTGADGKQYEMFCLPLEYIFGWLFTINPAGELRPVPEVRLRGPARTAFPGHIRLAHRAAGHCHPTKLIPNTYDRRTNHRTTA